MSLELIKQIIGFCRDVVEVGFGGGDIANRRIYESVTRAGRCACAKDAAVTSRRLPRPLYRAPPALVLPACSRRGHQPVSRSSHRSQRRNGDDHDVILDRTRFGVSLDIRAPLLQRCGLSLRTIIVMIDVENV